MKLEHSIEGKQVRIVTAENEVLTGVVEDYIFPEEDFPEEAPEAVPVSGRHSVL